MLGSSHVFDDHRQATVTSKVNEISSVVADADLRCRPALDLLAGKDY